MYKLVGYSDASAGIKEFVADAVEDLENIPNCEMGSTVYIISSGAVYMKDGNGEWVVM